MPSQERWFFVIVDMITCLLRFATLERSFMAFAIKMALSIIDINYDFSFFRCTIQTRLVMLGTSSLHSLVVQTCSAWCFLQSLSPIDSKCFLPSWVPEGVKLSLVLKPTMLFTPAVVKPLLCSCCRTDHERWLVTPRQGRTGGRSMGTWCYLLIVKIGVHHRL